MKTPADETTDTTKWEVPRQRCSSYRSEWFTSTDEPGAAFGCSQRLRIVPPSLSAVISTKADRPRIWGKSEMAITRTRTRTRMIATPSVAALPRWAICGQNPRGISTKSFRQRGCLIRRPWGSQSFVICVGSATRTVVPLASCERSESLPS